MRVTLSTAYLPPLQYISKLILAEEVSIEGHENYLKQSYRNRCCIYGANGMQSLVIPVKKMHGEKTPVTMVEIDFTSNWKQIHLKSIESAYRLSAFYEYYADDFKTLYHQDIPLLFDWNIHLLKWVMKTLQINKEPVVTQTWLQNIAEDYRYSISPKKRLSRPDMHFNSIPYQQVFKERYGFIPNLSIIDLIFNEGPASIAVLKESIC